MESWKYRGSFRKKGSRKLLLILIVLALFVIMFVDTDIYNYLNVRGATCPPVNYSDSDLSTQQILEIIKCENKAQTVRNMDLLGPITNNTVVIIVQVGHSRMLQYSAVEV